MADGNDGQDYLPHRRNPPGAHFWLRSASVPLTLEAIARMDDEQARMALAKLRWGDDGQQGCPACGVLDRHYVIRARKQWRCKARATTFSITSGTPFADRKLSFRKLLMAIFAFVINQKGLGALALRRIIGGQYRTAFTLLHKLRESILVTSAGQTFSGVVEMDGGHFSGKKRKGRKKPGRKRREDKNEVPKKYAAPKEQHRRKLSPASFPFHPNRRIVMVLREMLGEPGKGAARTAVAVCRSENAADIEALVRQHVAKGSLIRTDELPAYGNLKLIGYDHAFVNHSVEFSNDDGVNENQAESYFSRLRRACIGVHHRITPRYMLDYATEMGWREDVRRMPTGEQLADLVQRVFRCGRSKDWRRYAQGHHRGTELLFAA